MHPVFLRPFPHHLHEAHYIRGYLACIFPRERAFGIRLPCLDGAIEVFRRKALANGI